MLFFFLHFRNVLITDGKLSGCFINTTDVLAQFHCSDSQQFVYVNIECNNQFRVYMTPYEGKCYTNVMSRVTIMSCQTNFFDWNNFGIATTMMSLSIYANIYDRSFQNVSVDNTRCSALESIYIFRYISIDNDSSKLMKLLPCLHVSPKMVSVTFDNMSLEEFPKEFRTLFPNLQTLNLIRNKLTVPPKIFPWNNQEQIISNNIYRSKYIVNSNSFSGFDIRASKFGRAFILDSNNINDLSDYTFHGYLHGIYLKSNGMKVIGGKVFQTTTGLQVIDLSFNKLRSLPNNIFENQTNLRYIDISNNRLAILQWNVFTHLVRLQSLNLANNSLKVLPKELLTNLHQLKILNIQHNFISKLDSQTFPLSLNTLSYVFVNNNPIKRLPAFIFWIKSLIKADFSNTDISFNKFTNFIKNMDENRLVDNYLYPRKTSNSAIVYKPYRKKIIDLSNSKIESLFIEDLTPNMIYIFQLLSQFKFVLKDNPINCNCKILPLSNLFNSLKDNGIIDPNEYYFHEWYCKYPQELENRKLFSVKAEETYCLVRNESACPVECNCYLRPIISNVIVDCRNLSLIDIHMDLPDGKLELWYGHNNITSLSQRSYLGRVKVLDISFNYITSLHGTVLKEALQLEILNVQSNLLVYLPKRIQDLNLSDLKLAHNNFYCDCNSLWMKQWIIRNKHVIEGWDTVSCINKAIGKTFIEVIDSDFVCTEESDSLVDAIISTAVICFIIIFCVIVYAYRLECKVLMYVYLGIHPFDRNIDKKEENIDCVILHSETKTDWVLNNIVNVLEGKAYNFLVCDMVRDFIAGYSIQENLIHAVQNSKRIIFVLSKDWQPSNEVFQMAWRIAQEKVKKKQLNYRILVGINVAKKDLTDKRVKQFIKRGRYIDARKKLAMQKIIYFMPTNRNITVRDNEQSYDQNIQLNVYEMSTVPLSPMKHSHVKSPCLRKYHAFISYSNDDYAYGVHVLRPCLEAKGFQLCIPDRDFIAGASIEENVLDSIDSSNHTLLLLSRKFITDEWSLFSFRVAFEKSLREKTNHLIVILVDDVDTFELDKEVRQYLDSYVCISVKDKYYEQKLFDALPLLE